MEQTQPTSQGDVKEKPKWLVPLGESMWPDDVIAEITGIFTAVGLGNPLVQKLVEPTCNGFGGYKNEGVVYFDEVNWDFVVAYFRHEAIVLFGDDEDEESFEENFKKIVKSREAIFKKFGTLVRHYEVYQDPNSNMPIG
jgi:hypothetical protein